MSTTSQPRDSARTPRLLFFVTEDWYFLSHRRELAEAARQAGYEVWVATRVGQSREEIEATGFRLLPLPLSRGGIGPFGELRALWALWRAVRRCRPTILHNVALKPVLYGSLVGRAARVPGIVNAVTGLGFVFTNDALLARAIRGVLLPVLRLLLGGRGTRVIVQNQDDQALFGTIARPDAVRLVRGSGVSLDHYRPLPEPPQAPDEPPTVALVARMLVDKGVRELVAAVDRAAERGKPWRLVLAGPLDPENRSSLTEAEMNELVAKPHVEWWGPVGDVREVWAKAHVAALPSYGEGLPKALLEAAACGRALLATDVRGCRELVRPEENGLLVPPRSVEELAAALERLHDDPELRRRFGAAARREVEGELSIDAVNRRTLAVYDEVHHGSLGDPSEGSTR